MFLQHVARVDLLELAPDAAGLLDLAHVAENRGQQHAVPGLVVLVIAGIAVAEALGPKRQDAAAYGDEALTAAATLFKIAMLLAAVYLGWRMQRGPISAPMPHPRRLWK